MTTPSVYQGLVPNKTNGGLTSLQLALANAMATGQLPFGVNQDFLAAMRTFVDSAPLTPIRFTDQFISRGYTGFGRYQENLGFTQQKADQPDITYNVTGVSYVCRGDDVYLLRRAQDCGPDENRYEQIFVGKRTNVASGSFAYYGKIIFGGPYASGGNGPYGYGGGGLSVNSNNNGPVSISINTNGENGANSLGGLNGDGSNGTGVG